MHANLRASEQRKGKKLNVFEWNTPHHLITLEPSSTHIYTNEQKRNDQRNNLIFRQNKERKSRVEYQFLP